MPAHINNGKRDNVLFLNINKIYQTLKVNELIMTRFTSNSNLLDLSEFKAKIYVSLDLPEVQIMT